MQWYLRDSLVTKRLKGQMFGVVRRPRDGVVPGVSWWALYAFIHYSSCSGTLKPDLATDLGTSKSNHHN